MTEPRGGAAQKGQATRPGALKVMIVDPNPNHRDRLKGLVRQLPFVDAVSDRGSPNSILEVLAQNPVDVVMIDEHPGAADAFEVVQGIRVDKAGASTHFVLLTDALGVELRRQVKEARFAGCLQRPYDMMAVEQALSSILPKSAPAPAPGPEAARAREGLRDILDKLHKVALFGGFSDKELVRLLKICRTRHFPAGAYVFHEGEPGHSLYVLVSGKLEIRTESDGEPRVLVRMSPGDCFGEMAIIDAEPRSADAVAATECTVIEVSESVVNNNVDILSLKLVRQIAILLAKKLRRQSHPGRS